MGSPSINNIALSQVPSNVGLGQAQFDPKIIKGALMVPKNYALTVTQLATLQTILTNASMNDSKTSRIYPIGDFVNMQDSSEAVVEEKFGYGPSAVVRDGYYNWIFRFIQGGKTLNDALRSFNGSLWDAFFVDANNVLLGTVNPSDALGIKAITLTQFYQEPFKLNDGKKLAEYLSRFTFDPKYINEEGVYISNAGFDILNTILGLQTVNLTVVNSANKAFTVNVATPLGVNLGGQYGNNSGLAQTACFTLFNVTKGTSITLSGVTYSSTTQLFTLALTSSYTVGDVISVNLVGPTELATAGVVGFESSGAVSVTTTV